jgi:hemolysin III
MLRGVSHAFAFWLALVAALLLMDRRSQRRACTGARLRDRAVRAVRDQRSLSPLALGSPLATAAATTRSQHDLRLHRGKLDAAGTAPGLRPHAADRRARVWCSAAGGVVISVAWITAPRVLVAASYGAVGSVAVAALPRVLERLPAAPIVLLGLGALLYCVGAYVYAVKRPDPWASIFGFHEVFHSLVILAAASHFVAIAGWVLPNAA